MKKLILLFVLIPTLSFSQAGSCATETLRASIMEVMIDFNKNSFKKYKSLFITENELMMLIDKLTLDELEKEAVRAEVSNDFLGERIENEFKDLLDNTAELDLDWSNIEFEDFLYRLRFRDGVKELKGEIYFKEGEEHYEMRVIAAYLNNEYHVVELERLKESYELHGYPEGYEDSFDAEMVELNEAMEALNELEEVMDEAEEAATELDPFNKEFICNELTQLYNALKEKDYDVAQKYLVIPEGAKPEEIPGQLERLLKQDELSLAGIDRLLEEAELGTLEAMHGDWGTSKAERSGLNKDECYALKIEESNIECMFHLGPNYEVRFFRVDNIR